MLSHAKGLFAGQAGAPWRLAPLPALILSALVQPAHAAAAAAFPAAAAPAEPVNFDASFFPAGSAPKIDLSRFEKGNVVLPGTYRGDVIVNGTWQARTDIVFAAMPGTNSVEPCFDSLMLTRFGVNLKKVVAETKHPTLKAMPKGQFCGPIGDYIPGATSQFDSGTLELSIDVPQIYSNRAARGYVDPSQWDAGINAGVLSYNTNLYRSTSHGRANTSGYLGLNASLNLGSWHAVHQGSLSWTDRTGHRYQNSASYLQHDIPWLQAQVVAGDTFTSGEFFDNVRVRGVRLYSDDRMLPQSMRGYAPIVRGVAETNAHVVIRQNGYIIYDTNVAPGPFAIDDLYPTGQGGDLEVEVTEADGRVRRFIEPFSAIPKLLRPGQSRWSVTAGRVKQLYLLDTPMMVQGTFQRGLTNNITGYAGATFANSYGAALVGAALNTKVGAFSADVTHASNEAPGQRKTNGTSVRLGYNRNFIASGTNLAVATYRYSTSGFVGLSDAVSLRDAAARGDGRYVVPRQRSRMDINVSQSLGDGYGQLFATGSMRNYWNGAGRQVDFSVGYSNRWKSLIYSFSAQRSRVSAYSKPGPVDNIPGGSQGFVSEFLAGRRDTSFFFTVTVPLGQNARAPQLTAMFNRDKQGGNSSQASVSQSFGEDNRYGYGATLGRTGSGTSLDINGRYNSPLAQLTASYSQGSRYRQISSSASGSVVAHGGGVTLSPSVGETIGLVHAPDARGARVETGQGSVVDARGYAVVPNLLPYQLNTVALDPKGTDASVELKATTANVAPRARSVVLLKYETVSGRALMIDTTMPDGRPIPFGADVFDELGNSVGVAGQGSRIFVRGLEKSGGLTVRWGDGANDSCRIQVELAPKSKGTQGDFESFRLPCAQGLPRTSRLH